tara:strand:+ start:543 stop:746 length:204 start_codon:yes stop_codon:yes gene_type:complete
MIKMDNGTACTDKIFLLNDKDIELIVRMLHQELDAVHTILENATQSNLDEWYNRADHCEDLIIQLLK